MVSKPPRFAGVGSNIDNSISHPAYGDYHHQGDIVTLDTFIMEYTETPDSHRMCATPPSTKPHQDIADFPSVLIVLTALSFLPQLYQLWSKKDSTGISIGYVLANLVVATEQLTLEAYVTVNVPESAGGTFTHDPLSTGDWLNFVQTLVTWLLFLGL